MPLVKMPFGKYRDEPLEEIPTGYLEWVVRNCTRIDPWLRRLIDVELEERKQPVPERQNGADWVPIISRWYRELAMKFHPDRGGSHEQMQAINEANDLLKRLLGR